MRERELLMADMAERHERLQLELMDRVDRLVQPLNPRRGATSPRRRIPLPGGGPPPNIPAPRITFMRPAAKPSISRMIIPHGEVPSIRSTTQPSSAPATMPAMNSVDSRIALPTPPVSAPAPPAAVAPAAPASPLHGPAARRDAGGGRTVRLRGDRCRSASPAGSRRSPWRQPAPWPAQTPDAPSKIARTIPTAPDGVKDRAD